MYPGTVPYLLRLLGSELDDVDTNGDSALYEGSTVSDIKPARAVMALDRAQFRIFYALENDDANKSLLGTWIACTQNSSDTTEYRFGSTRVVEVLDVRDSDMDTNDEHYEGIASGIDDRLTGYRIGQGGTSIVFPSEEPPEGATIYARVIEEPVHLSYGTFGNTTDASTTCRLDQSPTYGLTILENDYYNRATLVGCSGTCKGATQRIDDYSGATSDCVVNSSWTVGATDTYSVQLSLPRPAWRLVVLDAAIELAQHYRPGHLEMLQQKMAFEYPNVAAKLRNPVYGAIRRPRITVGYPLG